MRKVQKISKTPAKLISTNWQLEVQHSRHMWVQCLPMGTKWQCMPMGMKVQHSGHMSAMRLKFPFSMFQRLNQHRSHGPIFLYLKNFFPSRRFSLPGEMFLGKDFEVYRQNSRRKLLQEPSEETDVLAISECTK